MRSRLNRKLTLLFAHLSQAFPEIREECGNAPACAEAKHHFEACQEKVLGGKGWEGEDCVDEMFHVRIKISVSSTRRSSSLSVSPVGAAGGARARAGRAFARSLKERACGRRRSGGDGDLSSRRQYRLVVTLVPSVFDPYGLANSYSCGLLSVHALRRRSSSHPPISTSRMPSR